VADVTWELQTRLEALMSEGLDEKQIILDPGLASPNAPRTTGSCGPGWTGSRWQASAARSSPKSFLASLIQPPVQEPLPPHQRGLVWPPDRLHNALDDCFGEVVECSQLLAEAVQEPSPDQHRTCRFTHRLNQRMNCQKGQIDPPVCALCCPAWPSSHRRCPHSGPDPAGPHVINGAFNASNCIVQLKESSDGRSKGARYRARRW
jgi:hypothetical protein